MSVTRMFVLPALGALALLALPATGPAQSTTPKNGGSPTRAERSSNGLPPGAILRLGSTRFRHSGGVRFIGYGADGRFLLTADSKNLRFWDAQTGKDLRTIAIKTQPAVSRFGTRSGPPVVLSGDGKILVAGFETGECSVVDVTTGKQLRTFKTQKKESNAPGESTSLSMLSHDGRILAAVESSSFAPGAGKVRLYDTTSGKQVREVAIKDKSLTFTAAALSRDGKTLLVAEGHNPNMGLKNVPGAKGPEYRVRFVDVTTGKDVRSLAMPVSLTLLHLSPDGKTLAVGSQDGQGVRLLESASGKERQKLPVQQGGAQAAFFSPDGSMLFTVASSKVTQWDLQTGKAVRHYPVSPAETSAVFATNSGRTIPPPVALSPDGRTLALPTPAAVVLWDLQTGKEISGGEGHRNRIDSVVFAPGGREILTTSSDGALYLWDVASAHRVQEFTVKTPAPDGGKQRFGMEMFSVTRVRGAFSPDGKSIAGLWPGGKVQVWDRAGKLRFALGAAKGHTSFSYSPDGRFVAANGSGGAVHLYDASTGRQVRQLSWMPKIAPAGPGGMRMEEGSYSAAFSPDGRVLLSGAMLVENNGLKVLVHGWEMASGKPRLSVESGITFDERGPGSIEEVMRALDSFIVSFVYSPDGRLLAEAGLSSIKVRDAQSGKELRVFGGANVSATTAIFSPDSKYLLAGQRDGTIRLWDVATATTVHDFPAHKGPVTALAFSPDGKLLCSGAKDTSLMLWDWAHLRQQMTTPKLAATIPARETLWADLAADDAERAYRAIKALATTPAETVALLKARLRPVAGVDAARLQKLLTDLDNKRFATRQRAEKELAKLADLAAKAIKDRLAAQPSLEMGRRLEQLLARLDGGAVPPDILRTQRAIEVLERIGTPAARQLLQELARGAAGHRVTEDARRTLTWLSKRTP